MSGALLCTGREGRLDGATRQPRPEPRATWASGVPVASIFGMPVLVHWRVLVCAAVAVLLATPLSPIDLPRLLGVSAVEFVCLGVPMMVGSIFAHELGHALAAQTLGLGARSVFVDLIKGHTVLARPAARARDELTMSLAGPFVNVVIWFVLGRLSGDLNAPLFTTGSVMAITASFNLSLVFNLLPVLPSDGGRAFAATIWAMTGDRVRGTRVAAALGPIVVGVPVLTFAAYVGVIRDDPVWGVIIAFIAIYQLKSLLGQTFDGADQIAGKRVSDIMCPGLRTKPETLARTVIHDRISRKHSPDVSRIGTVDLPYIVITDDGEVLGMLAPGEVDRLALEHQRWDELLVEHVMTPLSRLVTVGPETEAFTALVYMVERGLEALLVTDDGAPVGCVTGPRLMAALNGSPVDEGRRWDAAPAANDEDDPAAKVA